MVSTSHDALTALSRIPVPSSPVMSPDGTRIAYVLTTVDPDADQYARSIWQLDVPTGATRHLTDGMAPQWSPDGTQLAFLRSAQLWVMPADGSPARRLTDRPLGAGEPRWSPDGSRVAFAATVELPRPDGTPRRPTDPVVVTRLGHRAEGIGLRGYQRPHLFVYTLATGDLEQLTNGDWYAGTPVWSPDGTKLAFGGIQDPHTDNSLSTAPFVIDYTEGASKPAQRVGDEDMVRTLLWAPGGDALVIGRLAARSEAQPRLLRVPLDGSPAEDLLPGLGTNLVTPVVTSDGRLLCTVNCRSTDRVYDISGSPTPLGEAATVNISALSTAVTTPQAAMIVATPRSYGEVALLDTETGEWRALTSYTENALPDLELVEPAERTFAVSDGTEVQGWLLRSPRAKGPLLVDIHGGPHGCWSPTMDQAYPYQAILAAAGWTVLMLNPRGSDGFGDDFHAAAYGMQGLADERDFLEPVAALIDEGIADPDRLAVAGYSYGGFMTCWLTSRTNQFRVAVAGGLLCDLVSITGTADVGVGMMELIYGGQPWDVPETIRAQSPFERVAAVETPTLILHGERDDRSPVGQAEQWFSALHERGVDTELVLYPGADHMFLWAGLPSHRLDYSRRLLAWLADHID